MSRSWQTSNINRHINAIQTNNSSSTIAYRNNFCGEHYIGVCSQREETVLEKETVRITPLSDVDGPISTVIVEKCRINDYANLRIELNSNLVDQECQTDEFSTYETGTNSTKKSENMDDNGESSIYDFTLNTNERELRIEEVNNYAIENGDYCPSIRETEQIENKDKIEHIDVIVNESEHISDTTNEVGLEFNSANMIYLEVDELQPEVGVDEIKKNGLLAEQEIEVDKCDAKLKPGNKSLKEDDDDSCCVNCLYISLNVCDCVIL